MQPIIYILGLILNEPEAWAPLARIPEEVHGGKRTDGMKEDREGHRALEMHRRRSVTALFICTQLS